MATITVQFLDDGAKGPQSMQVTEALGLTLARGAPGGSDGFAVSFTSLLIGLLRTPDATGDWLRRRLGPEQQRSLFSGRGLAPGDLGAGAASAEELRAVQAEPRSRTASARLALEEAERRANAAGSVTDTSHLLDTLLTLQNFHVGDFAALGIDDRDAWAREFAAARTAQQSPRAERLDLTAPGVEAHVLLALRHAATLAGSAPIGPGHVVQALWLMASAARSKAFTQFVRFAPRPSSLADAKPSDTVETSRLGEELAHQLTWARQPLPGATAATEIWGRDLVTAALLCSDTNLDTTLAGAGVELAALRDRWHGYVASDGSHRPPASWRAWWAAAGVPLPGPRRAGYALETDEGDDHLGVEAEAYAFARLILDADVHPPLSIGLLGDWGSGKSFFIEQIKKAIAFLRTQNQPELHTQIVEIEFNAWHASDANLWASLVTTIFDRIWKEVQPLKDDGNQQDAQDSLTSEIEKARGAVHESESQVELGRQVLEKAEDELQRKQELLALVKVVGAQTGEHLQALSKAAGWHQPLQTIHDVEEATKALVLSGNRLRTLAAALLERPLRHIALPVLIALALSAGVWLLVNDAITQPWLAAATKGLAALAGFVGSLVAPLHQARRKVDALTQELQSVRDRYDSALQQKDPKDAAKIQGARREFESAQASVAAARARLAELLNKQAALEPVQRLGAFLQERVQSTQYRSQQGIISLVHKDFSELSSYMKTLRDAPAPKPGTPKRPDAIRPFDRIVLYVDDLDRCRPAHVVNMLEAVHLLLALDLFVVIVAVDSRWLTRALEVYYADLLGVNEGPEADGLRASTPQNYLEKIFQITYALAPMDPLRFGDYVAFLTRDAGGTGTDRPPTGAATTTGTATRSTTAGAPGASPTPAPAGGDSPAPATPPPRPPAASRAVRFSDDERKTITRLVPLLPTPRIAKRLVNVYRVIKAAKTVDELETFEGGRRGTACLAMLAVLFGRPAIAGEILRALHERRAPFDRPDQALVDALRQREPWKPLADTLAAAKIDVRVEDCARETRDVARYSLVTGHDWHTWSDPIKPAAPPPRSTA